jgi:Fur family ferric uptake transcriptional regulator
MMVKDKGRYISLSNQVLPDAAISCTFVILIYYKMELEELLDQVRQLFSEYLEQHQQRKTTARFAILEEIYLRSDHFDAEALYAQMKTKNYNISRATVYNTLGLLQECQLVSKHQFGKNQARFEKSYGFSQHDHFICLDCSKVVEFCDSRIHQITTRMGDVLHFNIPRHSLILYGHCHGCEIKEEREKTGTATLQRKMKRQTRHGVLKNRIPNAV